MCGRRCGRRGARRGGAQQRRGRRLQGEVRGAARRRAPLGRPRGRPRAHGDRCSRHPRARSSRGRVGSGRAASGGRGRRRGLETAAVTLRYLPRVGSNMAGSPPSADQKARKREATKGWQCVKAVPCLPLGQPCLPLGHLRAHGISHSSRALGPCRLQPLHARPVLALEDLLDALGREVGVGEVGIREDLRDAAVLSPSFSRSRWEHRPVGHPRRRKRAKHWAANSCDFWRRPFRLHARPTTVLCPSRRDWTELLIKDRGGGQLPLHSAARIEVVLAVVAWVER